jgi:hypothetical protein
MGIQALGRAQGDAEAGHHLVEDEQRAVLVAQLADALDEGHAGAHEVHVAGDRLDHHAGDVVAVGLEGGLDLFDVVVLQHQGVLHHLGRHAGAGGVAEGGQARAGLDQQGVGMAVVAAFELDDLAAAGGAARQADGAHAGLGAGETRRTCSMLGTRPMMASASSTSRSVGAPKLKPSRAADSTASSTAGWPWPRIIGPQEPM